MPQFTERYETPGRSAEKLVFADQFYLKPFALAAYAPQEFLILGLSTKYLRLVEFRWGHCRELPLPKGLPPSVEAAGAFDAPDHDLENRCAAGPSKGSMKTIRFGTGADAAAEYLHRFFTLVDRSLEKLRAGRPLLLMGVQEEIGAYRRAVHDSNPESTHILRVAGNIEFLRLAEIAGPRLAGRAGSPARARGKSSGGVG